MRTKTVKTLLPLTPTEAWDALVAPEYPPLFGALPEVLAARWVGNFLLSQARVPGGISVNIARVMHRPHRVEIATRSGRVWICLFDPDPDGTIWSAWIEGNFDTASPSGFGTESGSWLAYYEVQLTRWSETFSSLGWLVTGSIPDGMRWTLA